MLCSATNGNTKSWRAAKHPNSACLYIASIIRQLRQICRSGWANVGHQGTDSRTTPQFKPHSWKPVYTIDDFRELRGYFLNDLNYSCYSTSSLYKMLYIWSSGSSYGNRCSEKEEKVYLKKVSRLLYERSLTSEFSPGLGFNEAMKMKVILFS